MEVKQLLLIIAIGLGLALLSHADCPLSRAMIEGTNRIFTNRNAAGQYELKRLQRVRTNEVLHMICQPNDIVQTTCQRTHNNFSRPFPMRCQRPLAASATAVTDTSCPATMYSVGYTINNRRLELYRACYDRNGVRARFTTHSVYHKTFFPQRPCVDFSRDGVLSEADTQSFLPRNIYRAFRTIFGNNQRYIPNERDVIINRGHLTPSGDYLYGDQMCATFKYVNVAPMFKSINDRNWETIERWIRTRISAGGSLRIKTGTNGDLLLPDNRRRQRRIILGAGTKNIMPLWLYKVVRTSSNAPHSVFITLNNIFARTRPPAPAFCTSITCPMALESVAAAGWTYCCNATTFAL
ncbi:uncharacterized protein LOC6612596 [Drosophila sechellia]|uniref:GM12291 n=1 Tax=Drosophila sechellia TaxID=7238 RepID=B4HZ03_DROSE|nr:uncharacterized protein LOC6612596 [Drosophila sechellia]EDW53260.1 GM12291 [Drosophila sechellia]